MPVLYSTTFRALEPEWDQPGCGEYGRTGLRVDSGEESARLNGPGIHTRNGDTVELQIEWTTAKRGVLQLGFSGGVESAMATIDFRSGRATLNTSDWPMPQPVDRRSVKVSHGADLKDQGCGRPRQKRPVLQLG